MYNIYGPVAIIQAQILVFVLWVQYVLSVGLNGQFDDFICHGSDPSDQQILNNQYKDSSMLQVKPIQLAGLNDWFDDLTMLQV